MIIVIGFSILITFALAACAPLLQAWLEQYQLGGHQIGGHQLGGRRGEPRSEGHNLGQYSHWLFALLPAGLCVYFLSLLPHITEAQGIIQSAPWLPSLGVHWSFYFDGLGALFALLVSGFGALIVIYAGGYLKNHHHLGRFYLYLLMFMASMLGVVLAGNLLTLFVFWELTSIMSFFLIGYYHDKLLSRKAAVQALLVTGLGGLALLAGFVLIGQLTGTYEMSELLHNPEVLKNSGFYGILLTLLALGTFTKSAQFPFHFWLPNAMAAPTPVSAFLHSATMVKAGVYLLARFHPLMGETAAWFWLLTLVGGITAVGASILALKQSDMKRLLAYTTVMALGILVALLGVGSAKALQAMIVFLLAHSFYKAALFMTAGTIDHQAGSKNLFELSGLVRKLPLTFLALLLAAFSMAGLPLAIGFIGKELIYKSILGIPWLAILLFLSNITLFACSFLLIVKPFFGGFRAPRPVTKVHEASLSMWLPPLLLAGAGVLMAFITLPFWHHWGDRLVQGWLEPATSAVAGEATKVSFHLIPSAFDAPFILSLLIFALGAGLYFLWAPIYRGLEQYQQRLDYGPARWYAASLQGITGVARAVTKFTQTGNIHREIVITITTISILLSFSLLRAILTATLPWSWHWSSVIANLRIYDVVIIFVMLAGAVTTIFSRRRLTAITALGATGTMVALTYLVFAAPDLAITQFMIETLTVIIIALVMVRLPSWHLTESRRASLADKDRVATKPDAENEASSVPQSKHIRDAIIAIGLGACITVIMWMVLSSELNPQLGEYFAQYSVEKGKGHNIVNVILVDFRGVDTLGEITVLSVAALGVYALLQPRIKRRIRQRSKAGSAETESAEEE